MKVNDKIFDTVVGIVFFFNVNLGVSSACMLFLDINFENCLFYSGINATWMPIVSPILLSRIDPIEFKRHSEQRDFE